MNLSDAEKAVGRRNFLKAAAVLPAVGAFTYTAAKAGPVKVGIVGTGKEGQNLIKAMDSKYIFVEAMCDIRPDNLSLGKESIIQWARGVIDEPRVYQDYKALCRDSGIEAVVIATPLHTHAEIALEAMKNGKHVMVESLMAYSSQECLDLIKASQQYGVNLQVGHMRFYNPLYWDAFRMVKDGLLGNIYHIRSLWHQNTDWNWWYYLSDKSYYDMLNDPAQFDPTKYNYQDVEHAVNWRWYKEMSHGLWSEKCAHQVAIANWLFGDENGDALPTTISASGGKYKTWQDFEDAPVYEVRWPSDRDRQKWQRNYTQKDAIDNRSIEDHIYAIFEYPKGRTMTYSAIQTNEKDTCYDQIMGTFGTVILGNETEYYLFWEPGWDETKAQSAAAGEKITTVEVVEGAKSGSAFAAHVSAEATGGAVDSAMSESEPYKWELMGFADTIRRGAPNLCDGKRGLYAAHSVFTAQQALASKQRVQVTNPLA